MWVSGEEVELVNLNYPFEKFDRDSVLKSEIE